MTLVDYFTELHREDLLERRTPNKRYHQEIVKKISNSVYAPAIEANLIPSFNELKPFATRPLMIFYHGITSIDYLDKGLHNFSLKESFVRGYVSLLGKYLSESGKNLSYNLQIVINNLVNGNSMEKNKLRKLEKLRNKIELNELKRDYVNWFNKSFNNYNIFFNLEDFKIKGGMAKKDVREKYLLDLKDLQRERELKRIQKNK